LEILTVVIPSGARNLLLAGSGEKQIPRAEKRALGMTIRLGHSVAGVSSIINCGDSGNLSIPQSFFNLFSGNQQ
jgi:hypothetical protein